MSAPSLLEALEFAFADEMRPKQQIGPCSLYLSYSFTWKEMPNPEILPMEHFGRGNSLGVSVGGRRVFIQPTFLFGASDTDCEFVTALRELEAAMPFVPKETNYYRVEPKKSGKGEKLVKLQSGWRGAASQETPPK
ncbi:MAG: hypothetical protein QM702_06080 [Rubrivivax sp.]